MAQASEQQHTQVLTEEQGKSQEVSTASPEREREREREREKKKKICKTAAIDNHSCI